MLTVQVMVIVGDGPGLFRRAGVRWMAGNEEEKLKPKKKIIQCSERFVGRKSYHPKEGNEWNAGNVLMKGWGMMVGEEGE
jgi:hypothetical protein